MLYYPIVSIGNGGTAPASYPASNRGNAIANIQSSASTSVPSGFTFIGNWAWKSPIIDGSNVVLSNSNKTATVSDPVYFGILRGDTSLTGKCMFTVYMTWPGYNDAINAIGIATGGLTTNTIDPAGSHDIADAYLGNDKRSYAFYDDGTVFFNDREVTTYSNMDPFDSDPGFDVVDIAIDTTAKLVWIRINAGDGGLWNGEATGNPATGTKGLSISSMTN
jgi:hypothetical protein